MPAPTVDKVTLRVDEFDRRTTVVETRLDVLSAQVAVVDRGGARK